MATELPPIRRIVTAINASGKSYIAEDGPPAHVRRNPTRPGFVVCNLWATGGNPAPLGEPDLSTEMRGVMPRPGGTFFKVIDIPPDDEALAPGSPQVANEPGLRHDSNARHPGMHETDTIDYAIVLSGEIHALVDEGEVLMKAGDVLIHRGTNHAWANRSGSICRILFVLVDAGPKR